MTAVTTRSQQDSSEDVSVALARNGLIFIAASVIAAGIALVVGVALRGRLHLSMDDIIDVSDPLYPKQIDVWVVGIWLLLTAAIGGALLAVPAVRRGALALALRVLAKPDWLLYGLAGGAVFVPWFTNPAALFPQLQIRLSAATLLSVVAVLVGLLIGRRRGIADGQVLTTLAMLAAAVLALVTAGLGDFPSPPLAVSALAFVVIVLAGLLSATVSLRRAGRTVLVAQAVTPLLLLVLVTPLGPATTPVLAVGVGAVVLAAVVWAIVRARQAWQSPVPVAVVHPSTVAILTAYLVGLMRIPSGGVPGDEFHWGEMLVQWPQIARFGARPFSDFVPSPGLNGAVYGGLNALIGDNSITYERALQVVLALVAALTALLVCRLLGTSWALLMVPAVAALAGAVVGDRFTMVALGAAVLMLPGLWRRPGAWLGVWLVLVPACLLFMPGSGTAFAVATSVAAAVQAIHYVKAIKGLGLGQHLLVVAGLAVWLVLASTLRDLVSYVAQQGSANDVAWGLPMLPWLPGRESAFVLLLDVLRTAGWWLGLPLCAALLTLRRRSGPGGAAALIAGSTILLAVLLTPYTFGRIEKSELSRVGLATTLILGFLLPLAVGGVRAQFTGSYGKLLIRAASLFTAVLIGVPGAVLVQGLAGSRVVSASTVDGAVLGLPYLGTGPADQADSLARRASILRQTVADGQTFLDLGNNTAFYYFAGVPAPIPVPAVWNMISEPEQKAAIGALSENPPALVFVGTIDASDPPWWDPQLRSYRLTRWLLEQGYRAFDVGGTTVLLSPQAAGRAGAEYVPLSAADSDAGLMSSYPRLGLQFAVWGANWSSLQDRFFAAPTRVRPDGSRYQVSWSGGDPRPDFLRIELACRPGATGPATFSWPTDGGVQSVPIPLEDGVSLVPLGAYPSWYQQTGETFSIAPAEGCSLPDPESTSMLRLVK